MPYDARATTISITPTRLLLPWPADGSATSTAPAGPTASPVAMPRDGALLAILDATAAANSGMAPFSMPVSAEETRCSANGNMLRGNAIHNTPSSTVGQRSSLAIGRRDAGSTDRVRKPTAMRQKVTPLGPIASSPSAMNRNDAPQMTPGRTSNVPSTRLANGNPAGFTALGTREYVADGGVPTGRT